MNGPLKMYHTKQIVKHDLVVELPKCMYKLKNIHESRNNSMVDGISDHVSHPKKNLNILDQNNITIPKGMAELELRQENILQQLAELKQQLLSIRKELNIKPPTTISNTVQTATKSTVPFNDIVINASPNSPPYSLELAQKLLRDHFTLSVSVYVHSTVSQLSETARLLGNNLVNFKPNPTVPKLNLRLIWKESDAKLEFLISTVRIHGEINFLRYLARLTVNPLNYTSYEVDSLLDVCYLISIAKNKTARTKLLQTLNKSLGKEQFLNGKKLGVVDLAAYSTIKQIGSNELTVNLTNWLQRCQTVV